MQPPRFLLAFVLTACSGEAPPPQATPYAGERARSECERGIDLAARGRLEEAEDAFRLAVELDPERAEAHFLLGRTLVSLSNVEVGRGGEAPGTDGLSITLGRNDETLEEAIRELRAASELAPDDLDYAYWVGRALHVAKRHDEAIEVLKGVVARDPAHGLAHKRLGLVHQHRGDYEEAKASFRAAMPLLPRDPGVPFQYGNLLLEEDAEEARVAFERAIEIDPTFPWAYNGLVTARARLGDKVGAAQARDAFDRWRAFDATLKKKSRHASENPEDRAAQIEAGELYFAAGRWEEALPYLRRALAADQTDALLHFYCGSALRHLGEREVARQHLEEAAFLSPESVPAKLELVRLYNELDDQQHVTELLDGLRADTASFQVFDCLELAALLLELDRRADAAELYTAILAEDPANADAAAGLARARAKEAR